MKRVIEVYNIETGEVVRTLNVEKRLERQIERICDGMEINMDSRFTTRVVPPIENVEDEA